MPTTGCEASRSEIDHWTKPTQASLKTMCVWFGKWTRFLRRRTQLLGYEGERSGPSSTPRMWDIAPRNGTLDRNAGRNVKRSADVSGNARHFCDGELNYMIREKAVRNESLENPSQCEGFGCGHYNLHKSINPIRHCHIHFLVSILTSRTQLPPCLSLPSPLP